MAAAHHVADVDPEASEARTALKTDGTHQWWFDVTIFLAEQRVTGICDMEHPIAPDCLQFLS